MLVICVPLHHDSALLKSWAFNTRSCCYINFCVVSSPRPECSLGHLICLCFLVFQIRVVNAFRMGLEADSFDKRSLSSIQSHHSLQNMRMQVLKKSGSNDAEVSLGRGHPDDTTKVWFGRLLQCDGLWHWAHSLCLPPRPAAHRQSETYWGQSILLKSLSHQQHLTNGTVLCWLYRLVGRQSC